MLKTFTVSFFGHREVEQYRETEQILENLIYKMLSEHEYTEILIGRNGEFDQLGVSIFGKLRV